MSSLDVYFLVRSDRRFASIYGEFSYKAWREGIGLRSMEMVPPDRTSFTYVPGRYEKGSVLVAGGYVVGFRDQDVSHGLDLFGTIGPVDPYPFLAALASGGITGNRSTLEGYVPNGLIDIPVLKQIKYGLFRARDLVMTAETACDLARFLEEALGIEV